MQIAVIGTGYVGLSTGACLASLGHSVTCHDVDPLKISALQNGQIPIVEEGLQGLVEHGRSQGLLNFTTSLTEAASAADIVILCVPTPQDHEGNADISYVESAVHDIRELMKTGAVLVNKSTVPVGTAFQIKELLQRTDVHVVSNPEFLRQGSAVHDFLNPSRIVIGGEDSSAIEAVASLYQSLDAPILKMNTASAETLKYAANAFLATKLTYINAIADICEAVGADIFDVATGIGLDPRIGYEMLHAGPGWGGSCFPKDTRALVGIARKHGYDFALLRGVIETNEQHYVRVVNKVINQCDGNVSGIRVAAWGLTFKAGTDDLRDSPAIKILSHLHDLGAQIVAYDPTARSKYQAIPWIDVVQDPISACERADVLTVLTEWKVFKQVSAANVGRVMKLRKVVDARNILDRDSWKSAGFEYSGVGR